MLSSQATFYPVHQASREKGVMWELQALRVDPGHLADRVCPVHQGFLE